MPPTGNFGPVTVEGGRLMASGNSVDIGGLEPVSLHIAIVQENTIVHGPAQVSGASWVTDPALPAHGLRAGAALGLASQTVVNVAEGTPPSFLAFTWSENLVIAGGAGE
jgi:hypothetical protein